MQFRLFVLPLFALLFNLSTSYGSEQVLKLVKDGGVATCPDEIMQPILAFRLRADSRATHSDGVARVKLNGQLLACSPKSEKWKNADDSLALNISVFERNLRIEFSELNFLVVTENHDVISKLPVTINQQGQFSVDLNIDTSKVQDKVYLMLQYQRKIFEGTSHLVEQEDLTRVLVSGSYSLLLK